MRYNDIIVYVINGVTAAKEPPMTPAIGPEGSSHEPTFPEELPARDGRGAAVLDAALTGSVNTRTTYVARWRSFTDWSDAAGLNPLPASPDTVVHYLEALASSRPRSRSRSSPSFATVRLAASVIAKAHKLQGYRSPCDDRSVKEVLKKLQFTLAEPRSETGALTPDNCRRISAYADDPRSRGRGYETEENAAQRGRVDVALVQVLSEAGLSTSEASGLTWGDVRRWGDGSGRITVPGSRTGGCTQEAIVAITDETMAVLDAMRPSDAGNNPKVFGLSASQIVRRVKAAAKAANIDNWPAFNGRSGRRGLVIRLAENKAPEHVVQRQARRMQPNGLVGRYTSGECAAEAVRYL